MKTYKIERLYSTGYQDRKLIAEGLTLEDAQEHCSDPETSGSTCSDLSKRGQWFDSYTEEK